MKFIGSVLKLMIDNINEVNRWISHEKFAIYRQFTVVENIFNVLLLRLIYTILCLPLIVANILTDGHYTSRQCRLEKRSVDRQTR